MALADMGYAGMLLGERDGYKINAALLDCDVYSLRARADSPSACLTELEARSSLYAREYLEGKPYDWATDARAQAEEKFRKIQLRLADGYIKDGEQEKARPALERALLHNPYDEDIFRRLIPLTYRAGKASLAVKMYADYERRLLRDMGIAPSFSLKELIAEAD